MKLILVESPVKIHTINKYLDELGIGNQYELFATVGHISDLDPNSFSVERLNDGTFKAFTKPIRGKGKIISALKSKVANASEIYMCQDDDREGERISQDIVDICKIKKYYRVTLLSITKSEINRVFVEKIGIREIDEKIVLAQTTRRIIDRIIGYGLSPALSYYFSKNKILTFQKDGKEISVKPKGTGRVIGISLGILAKREHDIEKYKETGEYITDVVKSNYTFNGVPFDATGDKLEFLKKDSQKLNKTITEANSKLHKVYDYKPDIKEVPPYPSFTTSSLYSACSYIYDLPARQTKSIAQDLFEAGYINYPRTDRIELSNDASEAIISYLLDSFDESEYGDILKTKRRYKKKKNTFTQDAHEAIRPLYFSKEYEPKNIGKIWNSDSNCSKFNNYHKFVYELIWERAISTQMIDSVYDVSKVTISAGDYTFVANANNRVTNGWEKYYGDKLHASNKGKGDDDWQDRRVILPAGLSVGLVLEDKQVYSYEKHSRSPKRISEGALITQLVTNGIARPSTLHTITSSLTKKKYVTVNRTLLMPTELGMSVYEATEQYLSWVNNIKDAQNFEKIISLIENGEFANTDELIQLYWDKVEEFKEEIGYISFDNGEDREPSEDQKNYAQKIIDRLSDEERKKLDVELIFSSRKEMSKFLDFETNKQKKEIKDRIVGKCPKCDNVSIVEYEKNYKCHNRQCDFILWKNNVEKFMKSFSVKEKENDFVKKLLSGDETEMVLVSPNTHSDFKEKLSIEYNKKYKNWNIKIGN